jgi:hypothetical protein
MKMEKAISSVGKRRRVYAGGRLHILWDASEIVVQARTTGDHKSAVDATGVAVKLGIELTADEAADLASELLRALAARASAGVNSGSRPLRVADPESGNGRERIPR